MASTKSFDHLEHCEMSKVFATKKAFKTRKPHNPHHDLCPRNQSRKTYLELHDKVLCKMIQKKNDKNRFLKDSAINLHDSAINLHTMASLQSSIIDNL
jgi:hypothetical protein